MRNFLVALTRNPISLIGTAITTASAILTLTLFLLGVFGLHGSPYIGIFAYLILPAIFVFGLLLIPFGVWLERRRTRAAEARGEGPPRFPVIDLNLSRTRNWILVFVALTAINVVIVSLATYKGVEVMESNSFCGTTCHTVMQPEYTAYQRSPHARVSCVECHIGSGADWFVKSKLSGSWQVVSVTFGLYPTPIPSPIHNLRPARETCEQCHWPTKFVGDRLKVRTHYANDETNTELKSVVMLRVGGIQGRESHGIHWHVDPNIEVRYRSDESRETIYEVELTDKDGSVSRFVTDDAEQYAATGGEAPWRVMDCIDCHNRPSHTFRLPEEELDLALVEGRIDRSLPFVRREALAALNVDYDSHEAARTGIENTIRAYYDGQHPEIGADDPRVAQTVRSLGDIFSWNVFPQMKVGWGTYPNHIGHVNFDGCFRCHDDEHRTADGRAISQDCDTCHTLLAMEEEDPAILGELRP